MDSSVVTIELPASLYAELEALAAAEHTDPAALIARLVEQQHRQKTPEHDRFFDLIGAYHSHRPLIDDIPVSEDPDLYLITEQLGERAVGLHAWEIAPGRYAKDPDGRPVRKADQEPQ